MAKRNRKNRRTRANSKLQLRNSNTIAQPMQPPLPSEAQVHICGTRQPIPTDGLTPMQRELIREAARIQTCKAGSPIEATSITEQHSWGWTVYTFQSENEEPRPVVGLTGKTDERVSSNAYARKLASDKRDVMTVAEAKLAKLKAMRANSAGLRDAIISEVY